MDKPIDISEFKDGITIEGTFEDFCQKTEQQLAEERMQSVERQIHKYIPANVRRSIRCPYCGGLNFHEPGVLLCCDLLRKAIVTVLVADRALAAAQAGERTIVH